VKLVELNEGRTEAVEESDLEPTLQACMSEMLGEGWLEWIADCGDASALKDVE